MSYFPTDIPFMSDEEKRENGIKLPYKKPETIKGADLVPVIRCKDCRYFRKFLRECERSGALTMYPLHDTDFCSYGERREE